MTAAHGDAVGVTAETLAQRFPRLYHMAEAGSWPSIQRHGLLSTTALLDLFEISGVQRLQIEGRHRADCVPISHPLYGAAVVRDQKPMDDRGLARALRDGLTPEEWYRVLNARVFFWLTEKRLLRLRNARTYKDKRQTILTLSTAELLGRHALRVTLSPINTGCTKPMPHPRGRDTFLPLSSYPFASRRHRGDDVAVELSADYSVPDAKDFVLRVEENGGNLPGAVLWKRQDE